MTKEYLIKHSFQKLLYRLRRRGCISCRWMCECGPFFYITLFNATFWFQNKYKHIHEKINSMFIAPIFSVFYHRSKKKIIYKLQKDISHQFPLFTLYNKSHDAIFLIESFIIELFYSVCQLYSVSSIIISFRIKKNLHKIDFKFFENFPVYAITSNHIKKHEAYTK